MQQVTSIALAFGLLTGCALGQSKPEARGSIQGVAFTTEQDHARSVVPGTMLSLDGPLHLEAESDGEGTFVFSTVPAGSPGVLIVLHGPITKDTESDAQGAFAIKGLPPGTYGIEANASGLYAALAVEVRAGTSSTGPVEMNVAAVTCTTSPQLTRLQAMDCAFSRKVHHA
jgi:hypothetical protein